MEAAWAAAATAPSGPLPEGQQDCMKNRQVETIINSQKDHQLDGVCIPK